MKRGQFQLRAKMLTILVPFVSLAFSVVSATFGFPGYTITDISYDLVSDIDQSSSIYHPGFSTLHLSFSVTPTSPFACTGECNHPLSIKFYRKSMFSSSFYIAKDVKVEAYRCYRLSWDLPPTLLKPLSPGKDAEKYRQEFVIKFKYRWFMDMRSSKSITVKGIHITPVTLSNKKDKSLILQKKGFFMSLTDTITYLTNVNFDWRRIMEDCFNSKVTYRACSRRAARVFQLATLLKRNERWQLEFGSIAEIIKKKSSKNKREKQTAKRVWSTFSSELEMIVFGSKSGKNKKQIKKIMAVWNRVVKRAKKEKEWPMFPNAYFHTPLSLMETILYLKKRMPSLEQNDQSLENVLNVDQATASSVGNMFKTILAKCFPFCRRPLRPQPREEGEETESNHQDVESGNTVHLTKRMIPEATIFTLWAIQVVVYLVLFFVIVPAIYPHPYTNPYFTYRGGKLSDGYEAKYKFSF